MVKLQTGDGFRQPLRFPFVDRTWLAMHDIAVAARPRARVTEDHESRRAMSPAFTDVRTGRFLAHRVEVEVAHEPLNVEIAWASRRADLEPFGLPIAR